MNFTVYQSHGHAKWFPQFMNPNVHAAYQLMPEISRQHRKKRKDVD